MLILGMALALTNFLVDAGIPDRAVDWVQGATARTSTLFLLALCIFLFAAAALDGDLCRASWCWCRCCCR
jgi:C4-dicarboxylate transporter DctM subunit